MGITTKKAKKRAKKVSKKKVTAKNGTKYVIEKGIEMPSGKGGLAGRMFNEMPFSKLEVGDCFAVPVTDFDKSAQYAAKNVQGACQYARVAYESKRRFATRRFESEKLVRVWRVA